MKEEVKKKGDHPRRRNVRVPSEVRVASSPMNEKGLLEVYRGGFLKGVVVRVHKLGSVEVGDAA